MRLFVLVSLVVLVALCGVSSAQLTNSPKASSELQEKLTKEINYVNKELEDLDELMRKAYSGENVSIDEVKSRLEKLVERLKRNTSKGGVFYNYFKIVEERKRNPDFNIPELKDLPPNLDPDKFEKKLEELQKLIEDYSRHLDEAKKNFQDMKKWAERIIYLEALKHFIEWLFKIIDISKVLIGEESIFKFILGETIEEVAEWLLIGDDIKVLKEVTIDTKKQGDINKEMETHLRNLEKIEEELWNAYYKAGDLHRNLLKLKLYLMDAKKNVYYGMHIDVGPHPHFELQEFQIALDNLLDDVLSGRIGWDEYFNGKEKIYEDAEEVYKRDKEWIEQIEDADERRKKLEELEDAWQSFNIYYEKFDKAELQKREEVLNKVESLGNLWKSKMEELFSKMDSLNNFSDYPYAKMEIPTKVEIPMEKFGWKNREEFEKLKSYFEEHFSYFGDWDFVIEEWFFPSFDELSTTIVWLDWDKKVIVVHPDGSDRPVIGKKIPPRPSMGEKIDSALGYPERVSSWLEGIEYYVSRGYNDHPQHARLLWAYGAPTAPIWNPNDIFVISIYSKDQLQKIKNSLDRMKSELSSDYRQYMNKKKMELKSILDLIDEIIKIQEEFEEYVSNNKVYIPEDEAYKSFCFYYDYDLITCIGEGGSYLRNLKAELERIESKFKLLDGSVDSTVAQIDRVIDFIQGELVLSSDMQQQLPSLIREAKEINKLLDEKFKAALNEVWKEEFGFVPDYNPYISSRKEPINYPAFREVVDRLEDMEIITGSLDALDYSHFTFKYGGAAWQPIHYAKAMAKIPEDDLGKFASTYRALGRFYERIKSGSGLLHEEDKRFKGEYCVIDNGENVNLTKQLAELSLPPGTHSFETDYFYVLDQLEEGLPKLKSFLKTFDELYEKWKAGQWETIGFTVMKVKGDDQTVFAGEEPLVPFTVRVVACGAGVPVEFNLVKDDEIVKRLGKDVTDEKGIAELKPVIPEDLSGSFKVSAAVVSEEKVKSNVVYFNLKVMKINKVNKDEDGDNMDDDWESENNLSEENKFDAFVDPDEDNLANQDEFKYGTDPYNPDTDGDGYKDGDEILKGSNPLDETSVPQSPAENKPPIASFIFLPKNPIINQIVMFNASSSYDPDGYIVSYEWDFGDGNITSTTHEIIKHSYSESGSYKVTLTVEDDKGAKNSTTKIITVYSGAIFDTSSSRNPYPSIMGTHKGTITPNKTIFATKLYTYPCEGTGGHTEYARIWNETWESTATWEGYTGDWHNISFDKTAVLLAGETYFYEIRTGSYPQIHHTDALLTANGWINCTEFKDANGRVYYNWIPAIKLF